MRSLRRNKILFKTREAASPCINNSSGRRQSPHHTNIKLSCKNWEPFFFKSCCFCQPFLMQHFKFTVFAMLFQPQFTAQKHSYYSNALAHNLSTFTDSPSIFFIISSLWSGKATDQLAWERCLVISDVHYTFAILSRVVFTCWGRSNIQWQTLNTALCVTSSDPDSVVCVRLEVSHRQPAACCCTSIQYTISI